MGHSVLKRRVGYGLILAASVLWLGCPADNTTNPSSDYALSLSSNALTVVQGGNSPTTVNIDRTNFTGAVTLSLGSAPAGVTGDFNPAAPTGTSSTLTVNVDGSVAPGDYNLTVNGTSSAGNRSTPLTLTVTAATPDYSLSLNPAALTINQGSNLPTTVTITRINFPDAVPLSLGGAPAGVTGAFNPASPTTNTSTLTVTVGASVAPGVYNLTVDGTGTPGNRSAALTLTVAPAPDYTLSLNPAALTINQGSNAPTTVTITRTNFPGAVNLSLGGAPAGVTGAFNPAAPTTNTSTLTVTVGASVTPGVYNLTVDGTGVPGNRSTALTLTVAPAPDYSLSLNPAALGIVQGSNAPTTVTITRTNFTGAVTLSLGGAPAGVTGAFVPNATTTNSSTLTVTVGASVAPGVYNLTVDGTGTPGNRSTGLTLTVAAAPDYSLSLTPAALSIAQSDSNNTTQVTIARIGGFAGPVNLSLGGAPAGVTASFNPAAPMGTSSVATIRVAASVAPGVYNLTVDGTATAGNHSTTLTLTVLAADYSLSLNPTALTILQGTNAPTTVTITRTNFTGAVTLSLGGAPAGVTGAFVPNGTTGTTSTLTVSVDVSVAAGVYNLTVDGTGALGNRSTPLTLTVTAPDYSLAINPTALTINQADSNTSAVTITRINNFAGPVNLSLGGAPAGITGVFNPAAPIGTSSTLTVHVGPSVAPGVYNLTVDGTASAGNHSTPLTLTVDPAPDYSLSINPTALSINQGSNAPTTVTITRTNFTGAVTLSLGGAPAGVTGVFVPNGTTGNTSTLTVTVGASVTTGVYNLTVDGTGTPGNRSTALTLTVAPAPDYSLSINPTALTINQGANAPTTVTITRTNFTGTVTLSLGGAPAGVTAAFVPNNTTTNSSTLTVTVGASVTPGVYNLTVDGTGTPGNRSTALTLTVDAAPDYSLSLNPTALTIVQGGNAPTTITITRTNFTGAVNLSLTGAPAGVTNNINPNNTTGTTSTLTVTVGASVTPGVYNLSVDGTGTPGNRSTPLTLTVTASSDYQLSVNPTSLSIAQGGNAPTTVTITRTNFTGAVTLSLGGAPAGVTGAFVPNNTTGTSSTLTVTVGASVTPGIYNLTVDGTGTPGARSTNLTLTVTGGGGGNVTVDFSGCTVANRPVWLAVQDGTGSWVVITPVGNVYTFSITSGKGGIAYVLDAGGGNNTVIVSYMTQAEFTGGGANACPTTSKTITGIAAGLGTTDNASISLGGATTTASFFSTSFTLAGVADGNQDLIGYAHDFLGANADSAIIRRDQNIANGGSVGTMDFSGVEAFPAATATMTGVGLGGSETGMQNMSYQVGSSCTTAQLYGGVTATASFTASGIPSGQQRADDFHGLSFIANTGGSASRTITLYFHTMAAKTLTLPTAMPTPTVTTLAGNYKRLQAVYMLPADYQRSTSFFYSDNAGGKIVSITASFGYLGGASTTLALDNYSGLTGWLDSYAPATSATGLWIASGFGSSTTGSVCSEGATSQNARINGNF